MKKALWLAVIFILLLPQVGVLGSSSLLSIDNVFPNGSFELNPTEPNNGWDWPANDWQWDGNVAFEGSYAARVRRESGDETASLWSSPIPINASSVNTLSFWIRTEAANKNPSVVIYQYNNADTQTGIRLIAYANVWAGTNDWSPVNYRFQTMPDATQVRIRIYLYKDTTGTFWFDNFSLEPGTSSLFPFLKGFPVEATGWVNLSSPSVADINHDGRNELLVGAGDSVNGWDRTGNVLPGYPLPTTDRYIYNQLVLTDLDADQQMEILAGTRTINPPEGQCRVYAWQDNGSQISGWPISVNWNPQNSNNDCKVTSIVVADIDGNQVPDILASTTNNASGNPNGGNYPENLYAWTKDGTIANGAWPSRLTAAGFYGAIAAGDLNNDGKVEIVAARDHHMLNAYSGVGNAIAGWPIETYLDGNYGDYQIDYRVVYGRSAPILADLDGNSILEYIVIGDVTGPGNSTEVVNTAMLVLNKNGTRYRGWETPAMGKGVLTQDDLPQKSPSVGDINADGSPEIIAATLDGWIRAYDLHKNSLWEFNFSQGATLFAGEPVIGDIDGDNSLEVVFATMVPIVSDDFDGPVGLWSLESDGTITPGFPLPIPTPGAEAAPTLADLDGDGNLDILVATITGQIFVWGTPNPAYPARLPWPNGRHDLERTATYEDPSSFKKSKVVGSPITVAQGDVTTFTIHISSLTPIDQPITLSDKIPTGISYIQGTLTASAGVATENHGVIEWSGILPDSLTVNITYQVAVDTDEPRFIVNTVNIDTIIEGVLQREGFLFANTYPVFLPLLRR